MRRIRHLTIIHVASVAFLTLLIVAFASPAFAQNIRTYGDTDSSNSNSGGGQTSGASGGGKAWYPGMPTGNQSSGGDQQAAAPQQQGAEEGGEAGEGEAQESMSHRITIYSGQKNTSNSPRTTLDVAIDQLYRGVIPGTRDKVAHLARARESGSDAAKKNQLTWLGFRPTDSTTRVFFQTARKADYHIRRKQNPAVIEVVVKNTQISAKNFSRFIDTSFFKRNIKRVEAKKTDSSTVEIVIELDTFEQPTIRQEGSYVYLDFPHTAAASADAAAAGQPQSQP
jgi:hypothetical protein